MGSAARNDSGPVTRPRPSARLHSVNGIGLREASAKYGIPHANLSRWVHAGLIRVLQRPEKRGQPMLVYEADVAELASQYQPGRSRWNMPALDHTKAS